jgi:hypothetical protein
MRDERYEKKVLDGGVLVEVQVGSRRRKSKSRSGREVVEEVEDEGEEWERGESCRSKL